jgi:hypothetical protein
MLFIFYPDSYIINILPHLIIIYALSYFTEPFENKLHKDLPLL